MKFQTNGRHLRATAGHSFRHTECARPGKHENGRQKDIFFFKKILMKLRIHLSLTEQSLSADRYWEKIFSYLDSEHPILTR